MADRLCKRCGHRLKLITGYFISALDESEYCPSNSGQRHEPTAPAEQVDINHWTWHSVKFSENVNATEWVTKADALAYAAHVTKGLQAERDELVQTVRHWQKQHNSAITERDHNAELWDAEHKLREAAEARNVELMGELERVKKEKNG